MENYEKNPILPDDMKEDAEYMEFEVLKNMEDEKKLRLNFRYFNIFWYDPNKSYDFDDFTKCFENVQLYKGFDLDSIINFFNKESSLEEWIVISPGSKGEELISKLHEKQSIKAFFIFCFKPELHEEWIKKYEKIKCLTNKPEILIKNFIDINKDYIFPHFNFKLNESKKIKINFDKNINELKSNNQFALKSTIREYNELIQTTNKNKNKYNIFCIKTLKYLKEEESFTEFLDTIKDENVVFYKYVEKIKLNETDRLKKIISFVKNVTLISLYFSNYPYLLNLFSYNEIKKFLSENITPKNYMDLYNESVYHISEILAEKIMNNKSILEEKEFLKKIQKFAILLTFFGLSRHKHKSFIEFYQIINLYRDIDFSLKLLIFYVYLIFNDNKNIFMNDLYQALNLCDLRINKIFIEYTNNKLINTK